MNTNVKVNGIILPGMMYESSGYGGFTVPRSIDLKGVTDYLDILRVRYIIHDSLRGIELLNAGLYPCDENGLFTNGPWDHIEMVIL